MHVLHRICAALAFLLTFIGTASAGNITIGWDPSPNGAAGYIVLFGTSPGTYTSSLTVGNQTTATVRGLAAGQTYFFVVQAFSASGALSTVSNEVSGTTTNMPPQLVNPGSLASNEGAFVSVAVVASDAEDDPLTYTASGLPAGLFIDANTGVISGTIAYTEAGSHSVTITVSDGATSASASFTWSVQPVDRPPTVSALPGQSTPAGATVSLQFLAVDPDGDSLLYTANGLPPGLSINTATGVISGTVGGGDVYSVTISVSDGTLSTNTVLSWTVVTSNSPPILAPPGDQESSVINAVLLQISASDPDSNTLTFSASGLPPGLVINPVSGRITGQPTIVGSYRVTVSVSDGLAIASQSFQWTIDPERPPVVTSPGDQTSLVGQFVSLQINASDPDGSPLAYIPSLPPGMSINDQGLITGIVPAGSEGHYTAVVNVSDGTQQAAVTFNWTFAGAPTPPMFVTQATFAVDKNTVGPNRADLSLNVTGTNTMLIVAFHSEFDGGDTNWIVTDNGVPGTPITKQNGYNGGPNNQRFQIYYWLAPQPGPNAIVVENSYTSSNELAASAIVLSNVLQTGPLGDVEADVSLLGRTSESETVATTIGDLVVHVIADAQFNRGVLGSGETSVAIANDGLQKSSLGDGDASLWIATKSGTPSSTTVSSSGWPSSPAPAPRVMNGVGIVVHGAVAIVGPDLTIAASHQGSFTQGQTGAYTLTVANTGNVATEGTVTVFDVLPSGFSATSMTGTGWSCSVATLTCTRNDTLDVGASYPPVKLTVNVANNAIGTQINTATVNGDEVNIGNDSATDQVTILIPGAPLTPAFVQRNYSTPQSLQASVSVAYTAAQSAGDLNVIIVGWNDSARQVQSVIDSSGNTYALAAGPTVSSGFGAQSIYYAKNINTAAAGTNTVTVTFDGAAAFPDIRIAEYSGVDPVVPVDVTSASTGSSALSDSGPVTTTNASDLLVAGNLVETGTTAPGTGFMSRAITDPDGDILMDRIVTSIGSYDATATLSQAGQWIMQLVAFRAAGSTPNPPPIVTDRTPAAAPVGATVMLTGTGFGTSQGASTVMFNGTAAGSTSWSDGSISAIVPVGATSGSIVIVVGGVISNGASFTVLPTPVLSSRAPAAGTVTTTVTLTGTSFGLTQGASTITFNGIPAFPTTWSDTAITVPVPAGATSGNVVITVNGVASNGLPFSVLATPSLTNRSPAGGAPGASVTLTGTNFGTTPGTSIVSFNGTAALPTAWSDTSIVVTVPVGATTGNIVVTVAGIPSNGAAFTVLQGPILTNRSPSIGSSGTVVTLTGSNFGVSQGMSSVTFNGASAAPIFWTDTSVAVPVPASATTGNIVVTVNGVQSAGLPFIVNHPPTLAPISDRITTQNRPVTVTVSGSDPDGDALSYTAVNLPPGLAIDASTGTITGTPTTVGVYSGLVGATDGSLVATQNFKWTIRNHPPVQGDFDGDGKTDVVVFRPSDGTWQLLYSGSGYTTSARIAVGAVATDIPVPGDYDGDGKADVAMYRPSTGVWTIVLSSTGATQTVTLGSAGDVPAPGDYDGDGKTDVAIYSAKMGAWTILTSSSNFAATMTASLGAPGDVPVQGDYDGDGKTDVATYRPSSGLWTILKSSTNGANSVTFSWGHSTDTPAPADYDGDGRTDIAVYRGTTGTWYILKSGTNFTAGVSYVLGTTTDMPVPGDYDGDGRADVAYYRQATGQWSILLSGSNYTITTSLVLGGVSDLPVPNLQAVVPNVSSAGVRAASASDYDGDGKSDLAVFIPSSGTWSILTSGSNFLTSLSMTLGMPGDIPVPGDYDGDGIADIAVYRPSNGTWLIKTSSSNFANSTAVTVGGSNDIPVPGDYDGDGKSDVAVYHKQSGLWTILKSSTNYATSMNVTLGSGSDVPVPGDYDGDGKTDVAIFHAQTGTWSILKSSVGTQVTFGWGAQGDLPVSGDYDGDGKTDIVVYRPSTGAWYVLRSKTDFTSGLMIAFGHANGIPVAADFDGDGMFDPAVFNVGSGTWSILASSTNYTTTQTLGGPGAIPAIGMAASIVAASRVGKSETIRATDFDGDGVSDVALFQPSTGRWSVFQSTNGYASVATNTWGHAGDIPVPGDYDGDGKTDIAVYRPFTGTWFVLKSSTNFTEGVSFVWGSGTDVPVAGDYDGDGITDLAVFHLATAEWKIKLSSTGGTMTIKWGSPADTAVPGDYDGDGRTDIAVYHAATGSWSILKSSTDYTASFSATWGQLTDIPVARDYDGDGMTDIAVYRPSTGGWFVLRSKTNFTAGASYTLGVSGDIPMPGDYDGDGTTDIAVYRPSSGQTFVLTSNSVFTSTSTISGGGSADMPASTTVVFLAARSDSVRAGDYDGDRIADIVSFDPITRIWSILLSSTNYWTSLQIQFGNVGDVPVPGDYDGDGLTDIATYRPSTGLWSILNSSSGYTTITTRTWGRPTDVPVFADYDGDGRTDIAVYRPSDGTWYILQSKSNFTAGMAFVLGSSTDVPVPGDYDGDGRADLAVFNSSTGQWQVVLSATSYTSGFTVGWGGQSSDVPVPGDYDGDGKYDIAIYRASTNTYFILQSRTSFTAGVSYSVSGTPTATPVVGDYDGDGRVDLSTFSASTWTIQLSGGAYGTSLVKTWGGPNDRPLP